MLKISKSRYDGSYIVYDDKDFDNHHTHTRHLRIALVIRNNVNNLRIPKSRDKRMIESHIRVSTNPEYLTTLHRILLSIESSKILNKDTVGNNREKEVIQNGIANRHT